MSKTYCTSCSDVVYEDDVRWAYEEPYCQDCFDNRYLYCDRCDTLINRSEARFDNDDVPYCDECWGENADSDAPDNPDVHDADRALIIELSRNWLLGRQSRKSVLKINQNDELLSRIRDKVGLVDNAIYLFGLKDREEYQISASSNLIEHVNEFILLNELNWKVIQGIGCNRLGITLHIRKNNLREVLRLIKSITTVQQLQTA